MTTLVPLNSPLLMRPEYCLICTVCIFEIRACHQSVRACIACCNCKVQE